jgi:imidazolonepropionase-like amidohydrolase
MSMLATLTICVACAGTVEPSTLVYGDIVHTVSGDSIANGYVLIRNGNIVAVGKATDATTTGDEQVFRAAVVTPGLVDARATVGLTGQYNTKHDQDMIEHSKPMQAQLRAIDAYNPQERLVEWVRGFGTTTVHTGHAPGALISGRTFIVKTAGNTVDDAVLVPDAMVACTLGPSGQGGDGAPGNRSKGIAMLRQKLLDASHWMQDDDEVDDEGNEAKGPKKRDLEMEAMVAVLQRDMPLLVHANRAQDIVNAIRLCKEFNVHMVLDGGTESYLVLDELREAGIPVLSHPPMIRAVEERRNASFTTPSVLADAGIPMAIQTGYESYVPKVRVLVFEAGHAAANGLGPMRALRACTLDAATILGIADRVGSIEIGKDADLALWDGDPFEWTTHCTGVLIDGQPFDASDCLIQ